MRTHCAVIAGLLLALLAGSRARAAVISDNLGATTNGFRPVSEVTWEAQKFRADSASLLLTSATLTLFSGTAGSGNFFIDLYTDAAGQPGVSLANLFAGPNPFAGPTFPQFGDVLFGGLSQPLVPNTNYWIVLGERPGSVLDIRWGATSTPTGTGSGFQPVSAATSNQGGNWQVLLNSPDKMQITTTVPEPGGVVLLGLLCGGRLLARRRLPR